MKVTIKVSLYDDVEVDITQPIVVDNDYINPDQYRTYMDKKWKKFCKEHNFDSRKPWGKFYDLYLRLCAEGMI